MQAVLLAWESHGNGMISLRSLAQSAGLPASGIYHHFGGIKHLYLAAQTRAQQDAQQWCAAHLDAVREARLSSPRAFSTLLATLIDDWCEDQRALAFASRECLLLATRDADYLPALMAWHSLWQAFWQEICAHFGLAEAGIATSLLFDGESFMHLMRWRRAVDRAGLEELCQGWGTWSTGMLAVEGPWRQFARQTAADCAPELSLRDDLTERIASAAADRIEQSGIAGLTHRSVAQQAGLTLGVVSHHFHTSADLARAAFEAIYRRVVPTEHGVPTPIIDPQGTIDAMAEYPVRSVQERAIEELLVAAAREADLKPFVPQLRYLRGRTSGLLLQALLGEDRPISPLDAALFSGFIASLRRTCLGRSVEDSRAFVRQSFASLAVLRR